MTRAEAHKKVLDSIKLGQGLLVEFAADNLVLELDLSQRAQVSAALASVQMLVSSGSLDLAKLAIDGLTPISGALEQSRIDEFSSRLQGLIDSL